MKFSPKAFLAVAAGLTAMITSALASGLVPAQYVPYVAGLSTLLAAFTHKDQA